MNTFTFKMDNFRIIRMNNKSITLEDLKTGQIVFVSRRVFNYIINTEDNVCMLVNKETPNKFSGPSFLTWIATMMIF